MTKKELTALAKSVNAEIISNGRNWGFYYIKADKIISFITAVTLAKCSIHSNWVKGDKSFSVNVTLK